MEFQSGDAPLYRLRLFVAGQKPNSARALANLERVCQERFKGACELQIVDVFENPQAALAQQIVAAPALIVESPPSRRVIVGSLADEPRLLAALGLAQDRSGVSDRAGDEGLQARLEPAEALVTALRRGEIDALLGESGPLLLQPKSLVDEQARLRTEAERLARQRQATFDAVPDAMWLLDEQQRVVRANCAAAETFHCPLEEMIGAHCYPLVHGTTVPIPDCPFCRMRQTLQRESLEMQWEGRWFYVTADPLLDAEGNLAGAVHIATDITAHKRAEEQLHFQANLLANVSDAVIATDPQYRILSWNAAAEALYGWTAAEVIGQPVGNFLRTRFVDDTLEASIRAVTEKGRWQGEVIQSRKDGTTVPIWASVTLLRDREGKPQGLVAVNRDITERKRAEEALRESEARYRDLVENIHDLVCTHDLEGRVLSVNRAAADLTGYSIEEMLGRNLREILAPDVHDEFDRYLSEIQQKGVASGLMKVQTKSGETRVWEYRNSLRTEGVAAPIVRGFARDVTERIRAEQALRESEARNRYISETISDYAYYFQVAPDGTMRCDWVNEAFVRTFDFAPDEIEARGGWQTMVYPDDLPVAIAHAQKVIGGHKDICEMRFVTRHGEVRWLRDYAVPVWSEKENRVIRIYGAAQDITERKQAEEERLRLQEQLYHAQRMESVGRLAGGIAHDFNNILSVILGYGEVGLRKVHPRDPLAVNFQQIVEAAQRASSLTRQLLAFSRKQTLQPRVLNLNTVVQNLEEMLERLIGEDIALHLHLDPDLALVEVDPGQMEQVIMNLVVNARDAMPHGGQLIIETRNVELDGAYARTHPEVTPGPHVLLAVTDTGCGIEPELLDKIFEPFFTTKEKEQGTGLGLSVAYGIVRQSGGTIRVYSEPGRGTTFKIYLPQSMGVAVVTEGPRPEREPAGLGQQILVVEDEVAVRELLEQILDSVGYRVTAVANGGEALLWVEEKGLRPDLLLVDVILPGMDGSMLAARLQQSLPDLKVLYMSGYTDNVIAHRGVLEPGTHFIQKPFTLDGLTQKVEEVLHSP